MQLLVMTLREMRGQLGQWLLLMPQHWMPQPMTALASPRGGRCLPGAA